MKLCRFAAATGPEIRIGLIASAETVLDLTDAGVRRMTDLIERADLADELVRLGQAGLPGHPLDSVRLLTPVESQEVWAAGVTYLRSKQARMEESEFSANAYDRSTDGRSVTAAGTPTSPSSTDGIASSERRPCSKSWRDRPMISAPSTTWSPRPG